MAKSDVSDEFGTGWSDHARQVHFMVKKRSCPSGAWLGSRQVHAWDQDRCCCKGQAAGVAHEQALECVLHDPPVRASSNHPPTSRGGTKTRLELEKRCRVNKLLALSRISSSLRIVHYKLRKTSSQFGRRNFSATNFMPGSTCNASTGCSSSRPCGRCCSQIF